MPPHFIRPEQNAAGPYPGIISSYDHMSREQLAVYLRLRDDNITYLQMRAANLQKEHEDLTRHAENLVDERKVLQGILSIPLLGSASNCAASASAAAASTAAASGAATSSPRAAAYAASNATATQVGIQDERMTALQRRLSLTRMWRGPDAERRDLAALLLLDAHGTRTSYSGAYEITSQIYNDYPVWRQRGGNFYLFASCEGLVMVDSGEEVSSELEQRGGIVRSVRCHGGSMPHEVGVLQLFAECRWVEDSSITIAVHPDSSAA